MVATLISCIPIAITMSKNYLNLTVSPKEFLVFDTSHSFSLPLFLVNGTVFHIFILQDYP